MKKQIVLSVRFFVLFVAACAAAVTGSLYTVHSVLAKDGGETEDVYRYLRTLTDVLALVQKNYVTEVDVKSLIEGAVKGMLVTLDPHSSYLNPETYGELQVETKGEFGGLGIEITVKDGVLTVVAAIEDSPAYRAGVLAGDQIIKIGDEFSKDLSMVDAVKKMRGPKGTPVTISVHRKGKKELIPLTIIRDVIKVKSVRWRQLEDRYGYIRLVQFQEESATEFAKALEELGKRAKDKRLQGLVIDLRNNPGGLLNQATRIADLFLKDDVIVYTEGRLESQKQKYYAHDENNEPEYPVIVLVNMGSASASEIVAGAMQDAGRAVILGTQTFGKGSVQTILPMDNGGALRLTTALYFTKSGRSIQAQGITPDIVVAEKRFPTDSEEDLDDIELYPRKERELPGALKNPRGDEKKEDRKTEPKTDETTGQDKTGDRTKADPADEKLVPGSRLAMTADLETLLKEDPQLEEALKLLKTWNVFKAKPQPKPAAT